MQVLSSLILFPKTNFHKDRRFNITTYIEHLIRAILILQICRDASISDFFFAVWRAMFELSRLSLSFEIRKKIIWHVKLHNLTVFWSLGLNFSCYKMFTWALCKILLTRVILLLEPISFFTYGSRSTGKSWRSLSCAKSLVVKIIVRIWSRLLILPLCNLTNNSNLHLVDQFFLSVQLDLLWKIININLLLSLGQIILFIK